jgi:membrane protease subunit HflK
VTRSRLFLETLNRVLPGIGSIVVVQEDQLSPVPLLNLREGQVLPQNTGTNQ